jgi:hypothetical protein
VDLILCSCTFDLPEARQSLLEILESDELLLGDFLFSGNYAIPSGELFYDALLRCKAVRAAREVYLVGGEKL